MNELVANFWAPGPKDFGGVYPRRYVRRLTASAAAVQINLDFGQVVTADEVFFLEVVGISATPGAAQNFLGALLQHYDNSSGTGTLLTYPYGVSNPRLAAAETFFHHGVTDLGVFGSEFLYASAIFSAATNTNQFNMSISGWVVPRGSLQR